MKKGFILLVWLLCFTNTFAQSDFVTTAEVLKPTFTSQSPVFPGGETALKTFFLNHLAYPKLALENAIEGTVIARFKVQKDGSIHSISIVEGIGFGCDEAAIAMIEKMPCWYPAVHQGVNLEKWVAIRILFKLI